MSGVVAFGGAWRLGVRARYGIVGVTLTPRDCLQERDTQGPDCAKRLKLAWMPCRHRLYGIWRRRWRHVQRFEARLDILRGILLRGIPLAHSIAEPEPYGEL